MSLKPQPVPPVPDETARIARAAFPQGNRYLTLHDVLGSIITDDDFIDLFPARGRPAAAPWRLALVSVFQFIEGLSDRQAAEAVRSRIDWKYALRLDLVDPGFDHSVLSEFRTRLTTSGAEQRVFEVLVKHLTAQGWMRARGRQRTDSTHVLAAIRVVNRFEEVGETVRHTLNVLAEVAPDWLYRVALPEWRERYGRRVEDYRLPEGAAAREQYAATVGADGQHLLQALDQDNEHPWLRDLAAVRVLRQVWAEHYILTPGADGTGEQVRWRTESELARPLQRIASPYDPEARYHIKRGTPWVGYKVHVTETCDESLPHLMTNVATTPASTADVAQTTPIHRTLARRQLLPQQHLVDTGYVDAGELIRAQREHGLDLLGPTPPDSSWQSQQSAALDATHFAVDWAAHQVRCPAGRQSRQWMQGADRHGNPVVKVSFSPTDCRTCPQHALCTHGHKRTLTLRPAEEHQALQAARQRQATPEFTEQYALRAGVEGTLSQGVRAFGLRRSRYVGLAKTTLQHALTATALNVVRLTDWLAGTRPERTRQSPFVQLMAPCA